MFSLPTLNPVAAAARFGGAKRDPFRSLFGSGAYKGVYFDPSDLTTIYTDRDGYTPATMPGLGSAITMGVWVDKSAGPAWSNGSRRLNRITYSEQFDNAAWTKTNATISANDTTAPDGSNTADKITDDAVNGSHRIFQQTVAGVTAGASYQWTVYVKAGTLTWVMIDATDNSNRQNWFDVQSVALGTQAAGSTSTIETAANGFVKISITRTAAVGTTSLYMQVFLSTGNGVGSYAGSGGYLYVWGADLRLSADAAVLPTYQPITSSWMATFAGNHMSVSADSKRPTLSARVNMLLATDTLSTQNITGLIAGNYKLAFSGAGSIVLSGVGSGTYTAGSHTITCTAGTLTLTVSGSVTSADFRRGCDAIAGIPAYQRVVDALTYDTTGFPLFALFDGTDDAGQTPSIDFSGTDKMTVFAGVTKLSDAAAGTVAELSATIASNNGTFLLSAPNSAAANLNWSSKGTSQVDNTVTTYTAPTSRVIAATGDISAPSNIIRVNGAQVGSVATSQGSGNYGNFVLNIGMRNNASVPFNGRLYQIVVVGRACSAGEITAAESAINAKMGRVY